MSSFAEVGQELKQARRGRTQMSVAEEAGITRSYLCDIEKGLRQPSIPTLKRLAQVLGMEQHIDRWLWLWVVQQLGQQDAVRAVSYLSDD